MFSPVIGKDGNIYVQDFYSKLISLSPSGTLRWVYDQFRYIYFENVGQRCPAIGSDGTIYINGCGLHAVDPSNGSRKWVAYDVLSAKASPSIGPDGTIYAVFSQDLVVAINPDGSEKWHNSFTYEWEMSFSSRQSTIMALFILPLRPDMKGRLILISMHLILMTGQLDGNTKLKVKDLSELLLLLTRMVI